MRTFVWTMALLAVAPAISGQEPEQEKPVWSAQGRVVDRDGNPMSGVKVSAATGWGSLRRAGEAVTDQDGRYEFTFGRGLFFADENSTQFQVATFFASKDGYFEKNLCRQGDLRMALQIPDDVKDPKQRAAIVLPGKPRSINFVMLPAVKLAGRVIDENGQPLAGFGVSLKGDDMPPSSSVAGSAKTNEDGRFEMNSLPTGFEYQFLVQPAKRHWPWNAWASGPMKITASDNGDQSANLSDASTTYPTKDLVIRLQSGGVNWKRALEIGADHQAVEQQENRLLLTLSPPGEDQSKTEPESIKVALGLASSDNTRFQPAHEATIDLTERRDRIEVPESIAWSFATVREVRTKLSSALDVSVYLDFVGDRDPKRRLLVELRGVDSNGNELYRNWGVVADATTEAPDAGFSRTQMEVPRLLLADLVELRIGVRELDAKEIETFPASRSRTNLRISKLDEQEQLTIEFDNPQDKYTGQPMTLDPEQHQVIFQVVTKDRAGTVERKILRQLPANPKAATQNKSVLQKINSKGQAFR